MTQQDDKDKIVLPDDPIAATQQTMTLWVSRDGLAYVDEAMARWRGATHVPCSKCGSPAEKPYTYCSACRDKLRQERFDSLEVVEWDGTSPLMEFESDPFFWDMDEVEEYLYNCLSEEGTDFDPASFRLVLCEPCPPPQVDLDALFEESLPEDKSAADLPQAIWEAAEALNEAIKKYAPYSWRESRKAVRLAPEFLAEIKKAVEDDAE